jgi:hypothetical protein
MTNGDIMDIGTLLSGIVASVSDLLTSVLGLVGSVVGQL